MIDASLRSRMQYRFDFLMLAFYSAGLNLIYLFAIWVVVRQFRLLDGWTLEELFFLFSFRLLAHGVHVSLFSGHYSVSP